MSLAPLLAEARVMVVVGPGGVGKTTASAALGLAAARGGRRVLVLTADPARRLADAMGLSPQADGGDRPIRVPAGAEPGRLDAAMVLAGSSYDRLIARLAPTDAAREAILLNPMYQAFSRTLARSHAYVAMERLHDALHDGHYDLVVLDTPPASSAVDLLDAPGRLRRFLDARSVRWLLPAPGHAGVGAPAGRLLRATVGRIFGEELLGHSLGFFSAFAGLRDTLATRATRMARLLRSEQAAFVLVAGTGPSALATAATLADDLAARRLPLRALVFNRAYHPLDPLHPERVETEVPALDVGALPEPLRAPAVSARSLRGDLARRNARMARAREALLASLTLARPSAPTPTQGTGSGPTDARSAERDRELAVALVPELDLGPDPLDDLARLTRFLT